MIKCIPKELKLPNYTIYVVRATDDEDVFGSYMNKTLELQVSAQISSKQGFDKYVFCLFASAAIAASVELKINSTKMHIIGSYLYYIFSNNKLKHIFKLLEKDNNTTSKAGVIQVPSFELTWEVGETEEGFETALHTPAGYLIPIHQRIVISSESKPEFRPVILMHEIVEWLCFFYGLNMSHPSIQTLAEYLTYIVKNNSFLD